MEKINKAQNVIEYYVLCNKLKDVIRTGWKQWNVQRERIESVAEHVYAVQQLAIAMWSQYEYDVDIRKVIMMIAVHELEEIIIGDLTLFDMPNEEKQKRGYEAIELILKDLSQKEQIKELKIEFEERKTKEAIFAYQCDKLECDIQSKLYDEDGGVELSNQSTNPVINDPEVQRFVNSGKTWSEAWITFSRERYNYDPNFTEVSEYVEKNDIGV